jgi:hypothetical protein
VRVAALDADRPLEEVDVAPTQRATISPRRRPANAAVMKIAASCSDAAARAIA